MRSFTVARAGLGLGLALLVAACAAALPGPVPVSSADTGSKQDAASYVAVGPSAEPVRLAYEERGAGDPLLLIHGFGASTYTWREVAPLLADDYRVIAVDMKGFGKSDKPLDDKYSLHDQTALIADFIVKRNLRKLTIVGHSFGGGVALLLALDKRPDLKGRIKRLVILDGVAYRQHIPVFFRLLRQPSIAQLGMVLVPPEIQTQAALRIAYEDNRKATAETAAAYAAPLRSEGGRHAVISTVQQIVPPDIDEVAAKYKTIKMPVLLLWCENDKVVPLEIGWRLGGELPNATFHMLRNCGHMPQEEEPVETARRIKDFLAG